MTYRTISVNCRIGSLENFSMTRDPVIVVNCRIGSLEMLR